jgi:hypothetical protein
LPPLVISSGKENVCGIRLDKIIIAIRPSQIAISFFSVPFNGDVFDTQKYAAIAKRIIKGNGKRYPSVGCSSIKNFLAASGFDSIIILIALHSIKIMPHQKETFPKDNTDLSVLSITCLMVLMSSTALLILEFSI